MTSGSVLARLRTSLRDPAMRVRVLALVGGKMNRSRARRLCDEHLPLAGRARRRRRPDPENQRHQHGVDADRGVPRVRHAGRLRDARGRLRAIARVDQHPRRGHRRHLHLRRDVLGLGLRVHVRAGQRLHRHAPASSCKGLADTYGTTGVPLLAFWVFQFAFADTCSTITSGAMVGRCGFVGDILYSIGVTGFIYPIIGHWAWGPDGWLAVMRRRRSATSPDPPSCTASAAPSRWLARSPSVRGSAASSGATAAGRCCRTTSSSAPSAA